MRPRLLFILLTVSVVGCRTHQPRFANYRLPAAPHVITMPLLSQEPMTREQIEALRARLLKQEFRDLAEVKAALPDGFIFGGVSYASKDTFDSHGTHIPYTEAVFVCRLNEDHDLVIVEDHRSGKDLIQNWFIRDSPLPTSVE